MKAILEFNLPDDQEDFKLATDASKYCSVLFHFKEESLRRRLKYDNNLSKSHREILETLQNELLDLLSEYNISDV